MKMTSISASYNLSSFSTKSVDHAALVVDTQHVGSNAPAFRNSVADKEIMRHMGDLQRLLVSALSFISYLKPIGWVTQTTSGPQRNLYHLSSTVLFPEKVEK